jgi:hypothetical protein
MLWTIAFIVQTFHGQVPPRLPNYERHVTCWCEKCDEQDQTGRWTAARQLVAYGKQGEPSTHLFTVASGERITVLDGVVITDRADRVQVLKPMSLLGENAPLPIGDVFWIVQVGGEGSATVWHDGRMFGSSIDYFQECDKPSSYCSGIKRQRGVRQWWVRVRNARGQIGWVRADWNFIDGSCGVPRGR